MDNRIVIEEGRTALGIEFGSTRIKAVLTDLTAVFLRQDSMTGKTLWKTGYGHILWKRFTKASATVTRDFAGMSWTSTEVSLHASAQ